MNNHENKHIVSPVSFDSDLIGHKFVDFSVPGEPFAKQRPRAARRGRFITIYTPRETKDYEKKVEKAYRSNYCNQFIKMEQLTGALTVKIEGIFEVPKSVSKKKQELMLNGVIPHIKKPDADNMGKVCLDSLNGIAYPDDAIIDELYITKRYGENHRVNILIIQKEEIKQDKD